MASPAQISQRRAAGKASGRARGHRTEEPSPGGNPDAPMPTTTDPDVDAQMAAYVEMAGKPQFWSDIKACEQVRAEIYRTRAAARQDRLDAGQILTRDQVRARDESHNAAIKERLATVNELLAKYVQSDKLLAAHSGAQKWIDDFLEHVANAIEGGR